MSSKAIALLTAGTGTVTVSVGSFYLFGGNGTGMEGDGKVVSQQAGEEQPRTSAEGATPKKDAASKELKFSSLEDFKNKQGYKCSSFTDMFPDSLNLNSSTSIGEFSKGSPDESSYFGEPASEEDKIKSCLIINWEKKTYTEQAEGSSSDKWSGTFTWIWSFINDNKGFIVVNIATTSAGQLDLTGGAYLLEKQNSSNWEVKYRKEMKSTDADKKRFTNTTFETNFPKVKADSGVSVGDGNFWGFASRNSDLENMCGGSDACPTNVKETKKELEEFKWIYNKNDNKKISEWTENWKWWEEMYGSNSFDLQASLEKFKGTWSKVGG